MRKFAFLILCVHFSIFPAQAGRPVVSQITLEQLVERSDFIFEGWPSQTTPPKDCKDKNYAWQVHKVYKGDKSLEGKVVPIANHNYKMHLLRHAPSYASQKFKDSLDTSATSSFLFTNEGDDHCFELTAQGAQVSGQESVLVRALTEESGDCEAQRSNIERFLQSLSKECKADTDCSSTSSRPELCDRPIAFNKAKANLNSNSTWKSHQSRALTACRNESPSKTLCVETPTPTFCNNGQCAIGYSETSHPLLDSATIEASCAPHDAAAVMITISRPKEPFPQISIHWWGEKHPRLKPGRHKLHGKGSDRDYYASYCPFKGACQPVTYLELDLEISATDGNSTLRFMIQTEKLKKMNGHLPLKVLYDSRAICG